LFIRSAKFRAKQYVLELWLWQVFPWSLKLRQPGQTGFAADIIAVCSVLNLCASRGQFPVVSCVCLACLDRKLGAALQPPLTEVMAFNFGLGTYRSTSQGILISYSCPKTKSDPRNLFSLGLGSPPPSSSEGRRSAVQTACCEDAACFGQAPALASASPTLRFQPKRFRSHPNS
jgi:hypothetical protein